MNQETPSLQQVIKDAIEARIGDLHVALPGIVQSYNAEKQTADIQPCLKRKYADETINNLPLISNVPVIFPRTASGYLHIPLKKNDYVLLIFCERSIDIFMQKGGVVDPDDFRKHALSDAVAIPGLFPQGQEIAGAAGIADLVNGDAKISLNENGITTIGKKDSTPTENVPLGLVLKQYLEDIHAQYVAILDVLIAGDLLLTTSPGNPTAPNPAKALLLSNAKTALEALKASPITDKLFLSDILFTEKGN